jgi:hypothetical protein
MTLIEIVGDKIFFTISNLHFFNQSRGVWVDFNVAFNLVLVPDIADVFPIGVVATQHGEELELDI